MDKLSIKEIQEIVEQEGLEYTVLEYLSSERIEDETLKELWNDAVKSFELIEYYLRQHG